MTRWSGCNPSGRTAKTTPREAVKFDARHIEYQSLPQWCELGMENCSVTVDSLTLRKLV